MNSIIDMAIKHLSQRNCSEQELRRHLEKDFSHLDDLDLCIESAIVRLRELHVINDKRLAESLTERYAHKGNRYISQILRQKGIMDELITEVLANLGDEFSRALDEARQKGRSLNRESVEQDKNKLFRFLSGRGFAHDTIKSVITQLQEEGFFNCSEEETYHTIS
ncbi:regulatory protein RecX [Legionella sp. 227]|uniref:regulatory protein RecX n=1 Tax=Legionella sp. 227 TaxID=3367288 RepID=UPI00370DB9BC